MPNVLSLNLRACLPAVALAIAGGCGFKSSAVAADAMPDTTLDTMPDTGSLPAGPTLLRPAMGTSLAPTRAFLLWQDGEIPSGRAVTGYELCSTIDVGDISECANSMMISGRGYAVLDALTPNSEYRWKVRAYFDDGNASAYSALQTFSTDNSLVGWWRMDNTTNDASRFGHNGILQAGATYGTGFINQALSLDGGINGQMKVTDTDDHDFGTGDFSLAAWVFPLRTGVAEAFVTKRVAPNGYELFRTIGGQLAFFGSNCGIAVMGGSLPINSWHRAVATRMGTTVRLYIDGTMVGMGTCADNFVNAASLALGCNGSDTACVESFQGLMDEITFRRAPSSNVDEVNNSCADQVKAGIDPLPPACNP